jgi:hypothetical protein
MSRIRNRRRQFLITNQSSGMQDPEQALPGKEHKKRHITSVIIIIAAGSGKYTSPSSSFADDSDERSPNI